MHFVQKSIEIDAPVELVFEYLSTPANLPGIWPAMVEVSNAERHSDGWNAFDFVYDMAGIRIKGHNQTDKVIPNRFVEARSDERGIESRSHWTFERRGSRTLLVVKFEYMIPTPVIGRMAEALVAKLNERGLETMLVNLKTVLEAPAATRAERVAEHAHA